MGRGSFENKAFRGTKPSLYRSSIMACETSSIWDLPRYSSSTFFTLPVSKSSEARFKARALMRRLTSLLTRITLRFGYCACMLRATLTMRWSALSEPNTFRASGSAVSSITTRMFPRPFPFNGIQVLREEPLEYWSMIRMNSRASKFLVSLPFLNMSSSSSTEMGITTSCSANDSMEAWLNKITDVSSTKILVGAFLGMRLELKTMSKCTEICWGRKVGSRC